MLMWRMGLKWVNSQWCRGSGDLWEAISSPTAIYPASPGIPSTEPDPGCMHRTGWEMLGCGCLLPRVALICGAGHLYCWNNSSAKD